MLGPKLDRFQRTLQQPSPPPGLLREYWPVAVFIVAAVIAWMAMP